uniref:Reverse transcriptase domain-containing protein n=1 Tax=Tanacetum cinerariifolium TaxID=118510 RepID=A0A699HE34_TANCI|nr:hypothetical protein [Tanacetum cinerariifolium]
MVVVTFGDSRVTEGSDGAMMYKKLMFEGVWPEIRWHRYGLGGDGELRWGFGGGGELRWGLRDGGVCRLESWQGIPPQQWFGFCIAVGCIFHVCAFWVYLFGFRAVVAPIAGCFLAIVVFASHSRGVYRVGSRTVTGLSGCHNGGGNGLTKTSLITHLRDRHCNGEAQALTKHSILSDLVVLRGLRWDEGDLELSEQNLKQCNRKICDGHYTTTVRVLSSSGVAPYNDVTLQELKAKHPFKSAPSLPDMPFYHHHLIASQDVVLDRIKSFPQGTSCGRDGLCAQHLMDCLSGAVVAISDELISSITHVPGGGVGPIAVGTVWRRLVSKVSATLISHSLDGYLDGIQFGIGVSGGGEAILHAVNRLVEDHGDDVGLSMLLVDFQNAFNLVDRKIVLRRTHPIATLKGLTGGPFWSFTFFFSVASPDMRTCPPRVFVSAQRSFNMALRSALERIVIASGPGFGDWQWRLATLPFAFGGLDVYSAGDVLNYAFLASRLQYAALQTKLIRHVGIAASGSTFDDALCVFNTSMEIDFLSNPSEIAAPKLMKKMADIYFTRVTKDAESTFSLSSRQMALWQSQIEDHTSDRLRVVSIFGLGQAMNGILAGKEVDVGLGGGCDKALRHADMLLYLWDGGLDVCVDLTGSSHLTMTGIADFVPGRVVIDVARRKRDADAVTLLKRIQKFSMTQDTEARAAIHIFNRSAALQTKLLRHAGIVAYGSTFDDALCVFNNAMEIDFLSKPSEVAVPKLMKKMADVYFTRVTKDAQSSFSLSPRHMALWQSQKGDHTSDWLRVVSICGLGQTMNGKIYRCVLCYRLGVPLFSVSKPSSACSKVFTRDVYGVPAVSCVGIIGIKHRHNTVRDTLVDICFRSGISAGKEVDIGLSGDGDKALRPADILLYSWDRGLEVCVDLTGSSPLTQRGMADFAPGRAVTDDAHHKRGKYMAKCAAIGYGFLPFSFSSLGELETDVVTLLKRIRKFSMAQDIGARASIHIFNRISFLLPNE